MCEVLDREQSVKILRLLKAGRQEGRKKVFKNKEVCKVENYYTGQCRV